jgi:hypothetical protein
MIQDVKCIIVDAARTIGPAIPSRMVPWQSKVISSNSPVVISVFCVTALRSLRRSQSLQPDQGMAHTGSREWGSSVRLWTSPPRSCRILASKVLHRSNRARKVAKANADCL